MMLRLILFFILLSSDLVSQNKLATLIDQHKIVDFTVSNHEILYFIDKSGSLFGFTGKQPPRLIPAPKMKQLIINNNKTYVLGNDSIYLLKDFGVSPFERVPLDAIVVGVDNDHVTSIINKQLINNTTKLDLIPFKNFNVSDQGHFWLDSIFYFNDVSKRLINAHHDILDAWHDRDQTFILTKEGIWISKNNRLRKFDLPQLSEEEETRKIMLCNDHLLIVSDAHQLLDFDTRKYDWQTLDLIGIPVKSSCDGYGRVFYLIDGSLFYYNANVKSLLPTISWKCDISGIDNEKISLKDEHLSIHLDVRSISNYSTLQIEYRFPKTSSNWSSVAPDGFIENNNLLEGNQALEIRASIDGQNYSYKEISISKHSNKKGFKKWFWLVGLLFAISLLAIGISFLERRKYIRLREERDLLLSKIETMRYKQENLQLKMNPHFLFNALNSIQGLLVLDQSKEARMHLRSFASMMRAVLDHSMHESISLNDELKFLESYLHLERLIRNEKFDFKINCEDSLKSIEVKPMMLQPFVENAVLHGVAKLTDRMGYIQLTIQMEGNRVIATISDNGVGLGNNKSSSEHQSAAINIIRQRLALTTGLSKTEVVQYIKNNEATSVGTIVKVILK